MNHREKLRLARRMRTHEEIKAKIPVFQSQFWLLRKANIESEVKQNASKTQG